MRHPHTNFSIIFVMIVIALLFRLSAFGQHERGSDPVVDMTKPSADHVSHEVREQRCKRYNAGGNEPLREPAELEKFTTGISWAQGARAALPIGDSDAIVIGTVKNITAYLSQQKDNVYSEGQLSIERVLLTRSGIALTVRQTIDVQRSGGTVRFPSGHLQHFRVRDQGLPEAEGRYLFFLKTVGDAYYILTAYEFKDGVVDPLDGSGNGPGSETRFAKYKGWTEVALIDVVLRAINGGAQ